MKRLVPTAMLGVFNYSGKLLLTIGVVFVFLLAFGMVMKFHTLFLASQSHNTQPIYIGNPSPAVSRNSAIHPFWPEFPRNSPANIQSAVINGVQIFTEDWEANASALDILSYYREQMIARGWQDVTEETYHLQPELREALINLQDERYVSNYRKIMDSTLMLNRGEWSMHITAEPGKKDIRKTAVKIYAAATPSINNFFEGLGSAVVGNQERAGRSLDAVQQNGSEHYHTTIGAKNETPARAFQTAITNLGSQGWQPVLFLPKQQTQSGYFAWLVRGKDYAALSVKALPQGKSSFVTLTEVTPD